MTEQELYDLFDDEIEFIYIPSNCCQGKGRTDGKECCGGPQCNSDGE